MVIGRHFFIICEEGVLMDIYSFLNSKDIERHCRDIQYTFDPVACAYLISQSENYPIEEKHKTNRELMNATDNVSMDNGRFYLHDFLNRYIEVEHKLLNQFYEDTPAAIYQYSTIWDDGQIEEGDDSYYLTYNDCMQARIKDDWFEKDDVIKTIVSKNWPSDKDRTDAKWITAKLLPDISGISMINGNLYQMLSQDELRTFTMFETLRPNIPIPFQKGDIVYIPCREDFLFRSFYPPFVFDKLCTLTENSDQFAAGYFLSKDGQISYKYIEREFTDCLLMEHYPEELSGRERVLKAVSNYIKKEIDISLLLNAYQIILDEERLREQRGNICWIPDEKWAFAGLRPDSDKN